jgi:hypothetical protein
VWSPGNSTGSVPSAAARARDVRSQSCPADSSPIADDDVHGAQRGDVGPELRGRPLHDLLREVLVGRLPLGRLAPEDLVEHLVGQHEAGVVEPHPPGAHAVAGREDRAHLRGPGVLLGPVREQLDQRRLVRDHPADQVGAGLRERQRVHGTAAGPEHDGRPGVHVLDQRRDVGGAQLGRGRRVRGAERAAADAARVGGEHRAAGREELGEGGEGVGAHRCSGEDEERAAAAQLVVQDGVGAGEGGVHAGRDRGRSGTIIA